MESWKRSPFARLLALFCPSTRDGMTIGISESYGARLALKSPSLEICMAPIQSNCTGSILSRTFTPSPQPYSNTYRLSQIFELVKMVSYYQIAGKQVGSHYVGGLFRSPLLKIFDFSFMQLNRLRSEQKSRNITDRNRDTS